MPTGRAIASSWNSICRGIDPNSIDLTVDRNVLTVHAERRRSEQEQVEMLIAERPQGTFSRQLFLGETLDTEQIDAEFNDGVLTLEIPIAEQAKPRKVKIATGHREQTAIDARSS